MTNTQKNAVIAVAGLVAGAAALALFLWLMGAEEEGIRVKNGSVVLQTLSADGYFKRDTNNKKFKTTKATKGCANVVVVNGNCDNGDFIGLRATMVTLTVKNRDDGTTTEHVIVDNDEFGVGEGGWTLSADSRSLTYGGANDDLIGIRAEKNKKQVLSCEKGSGDMWAFLHLCR